MQFDFSNEYLEAYLDLICSNANTIPDGYTELHHIFPKAIFGDNDTLVALSYKDHFFAHWLLVKAYETEGLTREFMQMSKALFMFIGHSPTRQEMINSLTLEEVIELAPLIEEARHYNRVSSTGELNPFYGKKHSPETMAKIQQSRSLNPWNHTEESLRKLDDYFKNRDPYKIKKFFYHDPATKMNYRFSQHCVDNNLVPENLLRGKHMTEDELFRRSLSAMETMSMLDFSWVKRGEDSHSFNMKHAYNPETNIRIRIHADDILPDGFVYGFIISDDHLSKLKEIGMKRRGISQPWVADKINRNPEKIRKTADKHRGMKRGDDTKRTMSESRKKFFENGGVNALTGRKKFFDLVDRKIIYVKLCEMDKYINDNRYTNEPLIKIVKDGKHSFITKNEAVPDGWSLYAK